MPFGDYESMADCKRANSDKDDPGAYCATVHHEITGEWPGQKSAGDFFEDPGVYTKYAAEAMEETGAEPTAEKMEAIRKTAEALG